MLAPLAEKVFCFFSSEKKTLFLEERSKEL